MEAFVNLVLLFFIFSFIGWCIEVFLKFLQYHRFINRGFCTGPWLPIYGSGAVLITVAVKLLVGLESSIGTTFVVSFLVCGLVEYLTSWYLEKRFHARWWDYSRKPMNLNGRVWIGNLVLFGIGGVLIIEFADPLAYRLLDKMALLAKVITAGCLSALFITDFVFSHFVMKLVKAGIEQSEADNTEEIGREVKLLLSNRNILYRRIADVYPDVIYRTDKIKARMEAVREETEKLRAEAEEKVEALSRRVEEEKEEFGRRVEEEKEQLAKALEPSASIRNSIIEKQGQLIGLLYHEETATEEASRLMTEITEKQQTLAERSRFRL